MLQGPVRIWAGVVRSKRERKAVGVTGVKFRSGTVKAGTGGRGRDRYWLDTGATLPMPGGPTAQPGLSAACECPRG